MISITPIMSAYKQNSLKTNYNTRPILATESDSFERTNPSFSGGGIHLPVEEIEKLFKRTHEAIVAELDFEKKFHLAQACMESYKSIITDTFGDYNPFVKDILHETTNMLAIVCHHSSPITGTPIELEGFRRKYNNIFGKVAKLIINSIKRYDKGLDKNTTKPADVLQLALDNYIYRNRVKVLGQEVLDKYSDGITVDGRRINDYKLYTIFSNLIQNAAKYSPESSPIKVKFEEQVVDGKKRLVFSVLDEGIGIPKDDQEKVLNGQRGSNVGDIQGTGYGLNRVRKILGYFGSELKIESPVRSENTECPGTKISCFFMQKSSE